MSRFCLFRILGNDLPPRHRPGQSLENTRFILEHEPEFGGCEKRWILNRIMDSRAEAELAGLLASRGREFLRIPFTADACGPARRETDRPPKNFLGQKPASEAEVLKYRRFIGLLNVNAARNAALREGRRDAEWVLPLDGNCIFTSEGWNALSRYLGTADRPFYELPFFRLLDNREYFSFDTHRRRAEEPQLVFRRDCREEFDENYVWGEFSKLEMLRRLKARFGAKFGGAGTPGPQAGYVLRLFSGAARGENNWKVRVRLRQEAARGLLERQGALP